MNKISKLGKLRKKVNIVDRKLISLLAKRFKTTKEIILAKKKDGLAIKDGRREDFILREASKLAEKMKLNTEFITDIFKRILKESKK